MVAVQNLKVSADIGINAEEVGRRQTLMIDVTLCIDPPGADAIGATVDYREIVRAAEMVASRRTGLIETFATSLAGMLLHDPRVREATVTVAKPAALDNGVASVTTSLKQAS